MTESILQADAVDYAYSHNGPKVLDGMDIDIPKGKKTAVLGCNGAGKSTLFNVLNALYKPNGGTVSYDGRPMSYRHRDIIRMRTDVSILFQNPNDMMFKPYVEQDVAYGPENLKLPKDEVEERVSEALFAVGMEEYRKYPIMKLSYGQRKRVSLAGVLAMKPKVMIMDEPTAGLDPQMAYEVMEIADQMHARGVSVIMSSHDTDLTYAWTDEIRVLNGAKCAYSGEPEPFYSNHQSVQSAGLMPPTSFLLNRAMADTGRIEKEPYPKTCMQLSAKLCGGKECGTLHVIEAGRDTDVRGAIDAEGLNGMAIGVYGMASRMAVRSAEFSIDFAFNAPENCVTECMAGKDAVLICDSDMVESAKYPADFVNNNGYGKIDIRNIG